MNNKDKFITGQLFINKGSGDDGIPFDVYLGEHMTIFHKEDNVWIHIPYNKRSTYKDNFKVSTSSDEQQKSELRDFFWDNNNKLLCVDEAEFNKQGNNLSIALKSQLSELGLYNKTNSTVELAYYNRKTIDKDANFQISPSTKPSEIAKKLQEQLGTNFVKEEHITSIEQKEQETQEANKENQQLQDTNKQTQLENKKEEKEIVDNKQEKKLQAQLGEDFVKEEQITHIERKELGNPNEQTKLENQQKKIFCSPTIWCGLNLCSLCDTGSNKQIS